MACFLYVISIWAVSRFNTRTDVIQDESFDINCMFAAQYKKLICVWYSPYLVYITPNDGHNAVPAFNIPEHISRTVPALLKLTRGSLEVEGHKRIKATKAIHNSTWGGATLRKKNPLCCSLSASPLSFTACPFHRPCPWRQRSFPDILVVLFVLLKNVWLLDLRGGGGAAAGDGAFFYNFKPWTAEPSTPLRRFSMTVMVTTAMMMIAHVKGCSCKLPKVILGRCSLSGYFGRLWVMASSVHPR